MAKILNTSSIKCEKCNNFIEIVSSCFKCYSDEDNIIAQFELQEDRYTFVYDDTCPHCLNSFDIRIFCIELTDSIFPKGKVIDDVELLLKGGTWLVKPKISRSN